MEGDGNSALNARLLNGGLDGGGLPDWLDYCPNTFNITRCS